MCEYLKTVDRNQWIPHTPHPKQRAFLLLSDIEEVLYGGAAGGGKSDALLMAAAQYVHVPGYAALLLREDFPDLNQPDAWIPRSKGWWQGNVHWDGQSHRWTWPSGATITFGYLSRDDAVYQYQGAAFQYIGIDELSQHTEFRYRYMFSRLRRPPSGPLFDVPLRMRTGTNPGGKGHEWVKKRFIASTRESGAVFVPAKLADNPSLDVESYVKGLNKLDPITRQQLLAGDWDAYEGGRFKREWLRYSKRYGSGWYLGDKIVLLEDVRDRFLTVDTAATVKKALKDDPDYTVISAWAITKCGNLLWLGCVRVRLEVPDIPPAVWNVYQRHRAQKAYIEGGGTQKGVVQLARRYGPGQAKMNVIEVDPSKGDKLTKAAAILNAAQAGRVWLPSDDPTFPLEEVEGEMLRFTGDEKRDAHDDIVDTASIAGDVLTGHVDARQTGFTPYVMSN